MLTALYKNKGFDLSKVIDLITAKPAHILGVKRGRIAVGSVADLCIFDPDYSFKASGNEWYYAHNLLNVAEQYVNLREYNKADSV